MKKKQWLITMICLCILQLTGFAQLQNSPLWTIQRPGEPVSYVFVTGPACEGVLPSENVLLKTIQHVKTIAVEVDLYSKEAQKISKFNYASDERDKIKNNLSNADFARLVSILKDAGFPESAMNALYVYRLPIAYMLLSSTNNNCGGADQLIWEIELKKLASKNNLQYKVLCPVDSVIAHMSIHNNQYWIDNITPILNGTDAFKDALKKEAAQYKAGNLTGLKDLYTQNIYYKQKYKDEFQTAQASLLAKAISEQAKTGPTLFTVDVANIAVNNNPLFSFLKKMGFEIKPAE